MAKSKGSTKKASAGKKGPSPYNSFMKSEIAKVKAAHPNLDHKAAFKKAAENWGKAPENPKNKK